jgi:hypothetical protein
LQPGSCIPELVNYNIIKIPFIFLPYRHFRLSGISLFWDARACLSSGAAGWRMPARVHIRHDHPANLHADLQICQLKSQNTYL